MKPFDNEKYKNLQKSELKKRVEAFGRLYIEVGGKLFDDKHASRVLPGFEPDVKMQIFTELSDQIEVLFCINSNDIISGKVRADNNLTYGDELLRLTDAMKDNGLSVCGIVITRYQSHSKILEFEDKCKAKNISVYHTYFIEEYPENLDYILSDKGFGKNDHVKASKNIVLVAAPGANSGKMQTCLSQLYNDKVRGIQSYYAKYETFPVWNLPLNHLVNVAYEMATADLADENIIDKFHLDAYGIKAVNYNRDEAAFPILKNMLDSIAGLEIYRSPTDMGINNVGLAITDDMAVQTASYNEIVRRYNLDKENFKNGHLDTKTMVQAEVIMKKANEIYDELKKNG